jgi:hypothetical protein
VENPIRETTTNVGVAAAGIVALALILSIGLASVVSSGLDDDGDPPVTEPLPTGTLPLREGDVEGSQPGGAVDIVHLPTAT